MENKTIQDNKVENETIKQEEKPIEPVNNKKLLSPFGLFVTIVYSLVALYVARIPLLLLVASVEALDILNSLLCILSIGVMVVPYILLFNARKNPKYPTMAVAYELILVVGSVIVFFGYLWPRIQDSIQDQWDKPIIYIYPEKDIDVKMSVSNPEKFTTAYPEYNNGWEVKALTDGTLIDKNGKKYYALYWEGKGQKNNISEDGFVIKGEDSAKFLEEKLEILGLNYKESNEFIMYWLPKLEKNKYNYIRFMTREEIDSNMSLNIDPKPDTLIRVMMEYKKLDKKIEVKEQKLTPVSREGYTVVEWGGTLIK